MTPEEAYEKGQRDMRRKIEKLWSGWYINGLSVHCPKYKHRASVPVNIRNACKVEPLQELSA